MSVDLSAAATLAVTPTGRFAASSGADGSPVVEAFRRGVGHGLLHLGTTALRAPLSPSMNFARQVARRYFTDFCHREGLEASAAPAPLEPPDGGELAAWLLDAPPMTGLEYLDVEALQAAWRALDAAVREACEESKGTAADWLRAHAPQWRAVGRVTLHLAENRSDPEYPFAFLATYVAALSGRGAAQHRPLGDALREYARAADRRRLVALLAPLEAAAAALPWLRELVDERAVYEPLAWTPAEAHRLLRDVPVLERSGLVVRLPDWWSPERPPRPQVRVRVGEQAPVGLGADALLDFSVRLALGDAEGSAPLDADESAQLLASDGGLVRLRGRWVEVDPAQLREALEHWQRVARAAKSGGVSFFEGMRALAGAVATPAGLEPLAADITKWSGFESGDWLAARLAMLRDPDKARLLAAPDGLRATLRPYQQSGVTWLHHIAELGLGGCLADDMGLGKTLQVLALLLALRRDRHHDHDRNHGRDGNGDSNSNSNSSKSRDRSRDTAVPPSLVVAPASLIANWKSESERFTPALRLWIAPPSETVVELSDARACAAARAGCDLVVTTYGMLARSPALQSLPWRLAILDEAQAIRNPGTRQAQAVRRLRATARFALTGTPVENRAADLWSLFDFLDPGLLGDAKAFARVAKRAASRDDGAGYAPLRRLVAPYILRRLKTDRRIIEDLPDKTEVRAWCTLSRQQATLYGAVVRRLEQTLASGVEGIQRRGAVLAALTQLKQVCNHPAQFRGTGEFAPAHSGKFARLAEIAAEMVARQHKALVFTQFRELTEPLAEYLATLFGAPGLVLHGGTPVRERRALVEDFQRDDGPPFFVLSLKAGGTGLTLTQASHVVHFDRWWNPAVENQATDRAFRIGQHRNVLVHKFVCRGTLEEKIDALIESKSALARDLLGDAARTGETAITELDDRALLDLVALDIHKACPE